jgi:hypothetical protein
MNDAEHAPSGPGGEFEREPVPKRSLLGFRSFIGMYAGTLVSLPGWFIAAIVYIVGSRLLQKAGDAAPAAS